MKFFLDTADIGEIREGLTLGLVDGVTTNPSLIAATGRRLTEEWSPDPCPPTLTAPGGS